MTELTLLPAVTAVCYLFCEALKATPLPSKWLPLLSSLFGGLLGAVLFFLVPMWFPGGSHVGNALLSGFGSGLTATGAYEAVMQFWKKK